ncbi:response regulator [Desulfofundulus salinus]|uniref:response regulator n=1 Tax=Desulfofundulus salinus TaxID=2419843 RepID=UPI001FA97BA5|nr:response regulator [Desulfofundulus salinum]
MYKILLAEDEELERRFLHHLVEIAGLPLVVVGEATNGREAVELAELLQPEIILMDIKMPGIDGLAATRTIKEKKPAVEVIIITAYGEFSYSQQPSGSFKPGLFKPPVQTVHGPELYRLPYRGLA